MNPIDEILARAMAKTASNTERSDENSADVKAAIPSSVDETNSSDIIGSVAKENTVVLTGAVATTDEKEDGLPKETNDGDAFKEASASELASVASDIMATIVKASADALDVDAPENGAQTENSPDATGNEEDVSDNGTEPVNASSTPSKEAADLPDAMQDSGDTSSKDDSEGELKVTDSSGEEEEKEASETLEKEFEQFISLREKFAGIEEMLTGIDGQAQGDAGNVAEFLQAFQEAPGLDAGAEGQAPLMDEEAEVAPEGVPEAPGEELGGEAPVEGEAGLGEELGGLDGGLGGGGEEDALQELVQILEQAGISPEDFTQQVGDLGAEEAKIAATKADGWKSLTKEAKRSLVEKALRDNLLNKGA